MNEISPIKIFYMAESTLINLKKTKSIQKISRLKGKVIVDKDIHNLSKYILKLTSTITQIDKSQGKNKQ